MSGIFSFGVFGRHWQVRGGREIGFPPFVAGRSVRNPKQHAGAEASSVPPGRAEARHADEGVRGYVTPLPPIRTSLASGSACGARRSQSLAEIFRRWDRPGLLRLRAWLLPATGGRESG